MISESFERDGEDIVLRFDSRQKSLVDSIIEDEEARYEFEVRPDEPEMEDGIVLTANRRACLALARIFGQLACCDLQEGYAVRLGWDETDAVGLRIVLDESGRMDGQSDEQDT